MVIDILRDCKISNATIILGCPIKEEIESPEIQQLEPQMELDSMEITRKNLE